MGSGSQGIVLLSLGNSKTSRFAFWVDYYLQMLHLFPHQSTYSTLFNFPKSTYLWTKAMRSAARPEPSQTTTGTGGTSVTYSKTARIVLIPPSITKHTTGVLQCVPERRESQKLSSCDTFDRLGKTFVKIKNTQHRREIGFRDYLVYRLIKISHSFI